jgi:O-antigen/teichoic acid export membrane protein
MLSRISPHSLMLVTGSAILSRFCSAAAQIVAGVFLNPVEFGIFATASGIMIFTSMVRAGGAATHYQTMTVAEFQAEGGRLFRYSLKVVSFGVLLSLLVTWLSASWFAERNGYSSTEFAWTLGVLIVNYVLFNTATYPRYLMIAQNRIREISSLEVTLGLTRLFGMFLLASSGAGPLALAGATTAVQVVENLWVWCRCGLRWREIMDPGPPGNFLSIFREMRLPLLLAILGNLNMQTETLVGSLFLPVTTIGLYFFALQISNQPAMLMGSSLRSIFASAGAHVRGDPVLAAQTLRQTFNGGMVIIPMVMMAIPAIFEPIERAVWNGKWAECRWPLLILSVTMLYPTVLQLVSAPVTGFRDWKLAIRIDLLRSWPKLIAGVVAGFIASRLDFGSVSASVLLAIAAGGITALVSMKELHRILRQADATTSSIVYELYSTPLAAILSAVAASGLGHSLAEPLSTSAGPRAAAIVETLLSGTIYGTLCLLLIRFGYTPTLEQLLRGLPSAFANPLRRLLRM